jgi:quinol monooxygenase YgiN
MILIVLKVPIRAGRRDEWLAGIKRYTDAVRGEPGGPEFECFQSIETPDTFVLVEGFASRAAGERHVQTEHFKEVMTWLPTVIAAPPRIINVEVPEGWSAMAELGQS